jgi:hypothetical protein
MPLLPLPGDGDGEGGSGDGPGPGPGPGPELGECVEGAGVERLGLRVAVVMQSAPTRNLPDRRCCPVMNGRARLSCSVRNRQLLASGIVAAGSHQSKPQGWFSPGAKNRFHMRLNISPRLVSGHHSGAEQLTLVGQFVPDVVLQRDTDCSPQCSALPSLRADPGSYRQTCPLGTAGMMDAQMSNNVIECKGAGGIKSRRIVI